MLTGISASFAIIRQTRIAGPMINFVNCAAAARRL